MPKIEIFFQPRPKKWRGGGQKQIVRADGSLGVWGKGFRPPSQSVERSEDAIIIPDFPRKKFELYPKIGTNSQKTENRPKKAKEKYQVEGGAEFPPETPLPPRPHICWPFWELQEQMQKAREAKKRGRGRVKKKKKKYNFL